MIFADIVLGIFYIMTMLFFLVVDMIALPVLQIGTLPSSRRLCFYSALVYIEHESIASISTGESKSWYYVTELRGPSSNTKDIKMRAGPRSRGYLLIDRWDRVKIKHLRE